MSSKHLQEIDLDKLKAGMYIVKLDIPWLDSPFIKNSRLIKSDSDITKLKKAGVKQVVIDITKGIAPAEKPLSGNAKSSRPTQINNHKSKKPQGSQSQRSDLKQEMAAAQSIRSQLKSIVTDLNSKLERELPVDASAITPLVTQTLESLERNNQALLSLSHLSRKSQKLADHCFSTFCLTLSLEPVVMKLPEDERNALAIAALLHETGWLQLPIKLMGKRTRYTATEKSLVQSHTSIGVKMLEKSNIPELSKRIIAEHHERLNGTGYPNQLNKESIHICSQILSVADQYDELVHQLCDSPGMLPTNALRKLYVDAEKGIFNSDVVAALIGVLGIYPATSAVVLNTGERAIVEEVYPEAHLTPVITIHYDKNHKPLNDPIRIDLRKPAHDNIERSISSVLDPSTPQTDPARRLLLEVE